MFHFLNQRNSLQLQIVGEIYDEDDEEDFVFAEDSIIFQEDGTFLIRGDADLEDVDAVLGLNLDEEEVLREYGTLSGFLCFCAGEIPRVGDFIMSRGWNFVVENADEKRIFQVKVERLLGFFEGEDGEDGDENLVRGFFSGRGYKGTSENEVMGVEMEVNASMQMAAENNANKNMDAAHHAEGGESSVGVVSAAVDASLEENLTHAEALTRQARKLNINDASRVERLVEQNEMKAAAVIAESKLKEEEEQSKEEDASASEP